MVNFFEKLAKALKQCSKVGILGNLWNLCSRTHWIEPSKVTRHWEFLTSHCIIKMKKRILYGKNCCSMTVKANTTSVLTIVVYD